KLQSIFPHMKPAWTARATLPGGEFQSQLTLANELAQTYPWLDPLLINAWIKRYGSLVHTVLDGAKSTSDLGALLGPGLYQRAVNYLRRHEWACNAEDIVWRRTKLGLDFSDAQRAALDDYLQRNH